MERLAEFKKLFQRSVKAMSEILKAYKPDVTELECEEFYETFSAFLFGVFPFTKHTEKQIAAMELANVKLNEPSIYEMVYRCLSRLIVERE